MIGSSIKLLTLLLMVAVLPGCATTPIGGNQANNIPAERHLRFKNQSSDTASVIVTRDTGFMSAACATRVFVNGELAAYVRAGERVTLNISAGEIILGAQPDGICAGGLVEIEAKLQAGRIIRYRIAYDHNGSLGLYRTAVQ